MNLPNILTVSRVFFAGLFLLFFLREESWAAYLAFISFSLGAITDCLDGYFARKNNQITNFGKILDPITDKILVLSAFYGFVYLTYISAWMFWVIALREILVTTSRLFLLRKATVLAAENAGKIKTIAQMVTIFVILAIHVLIHSTEDPSSWVFQQTSLTIYFVVSQILMALTVALTLYSGLQYFYNNRSKLY